MVHADRHCVPVDSPIHDRARDRSRGGLPIGSNPPEMARVHRRSSLLTPRQRESAESATTPTRDLVPAVSMRPIQIPAAAGHRGPPKTRPDGSRVADLQPGHSAQRLAPDYSADIGPRNSGYACNLKPPSRRSAGHQHPCTLARQSFRLARRMHQSISTEILIERNRLIALKNVDLTSVAVAAANHDERKRSKVPPSFAGRNENPADS